MSARTDSHTISHAENIFSGDAYTPGANDSGRGLPVRQVIDDIIKATNILAQDPNGYVAAAVTPVGSVTLNGALVTAGVGNADVARNVSVDSSNAGDTTQVVTVTGTDAYGAILVENITLNGTTEVDGKKAFRTVTAVSVDVVLAGNLDVGTGNIIGLNYRLDAVDDVDFVTQGGDAKVASVGAGTLVLADTTSPATAVTGDVRGTYLVDAEPFPLIIVYKPAGRKTVTAFGVPQFSG